METLKANFFIPIFLLLPVLLSAQIDPGTPFDLQGFIDDEISAGNTTIVIPPGRHRVSPNGGTNFHIRLHDLNNITIIGDDAEIIFTETLQGFYIRNCTNLSIRGLSLDYDPLPFTQGEIVYISPDKTEIIADIIDGYSTTIIGDKLEIYDAITEELAIRTFYGITYEVDEDNRQVVITKGTSSSDHLLKLGDIVVLDSEGSRTIPHTIYARDSPNLNFENITIFSSTSFSFLETGCNGSTYANCTIDRRPVENELRPRGLKRMRSGNLDAFHSKHAEIGPSYVGCVARFNGDDSFAINGDFHFISETNGDILTVIAKGGGNNIPNIQVGEAVEMIAYSGERIPNAVVTNIEVGRPLNETEITFLQNYSGFRGAAATTYTAANVYFVTIDRAVDLPLGSLINSAARVGNGFEVRNCIAGPNRSRGILVKASNGVITGNSCVGNWGNAIKSSPEYNWFEAGSNNNVEISDNEIIRCRSTAIRVDAQGGDGSTPQAGAHDNIRIFNNQISDHLGSSDGIFTITSTRNLCFYDNTYEIGGPEVELENVELTLDSDNDGIPDCPDTGVFPLDFLSFSTTPLENCSWLSWTTTNEEGVSHFEVLRLSDTQWKKIGEKRAINQPHASYNFKDGSVFSGQTYIYQIVGVDHDGTQTISEKRSVTFGGQSPINVYPNPSTEFITVDAPQGSWLKVYDLNGKFIHSSRIGTSSKTTVNCSTWLAGKYTFLLQDTAENYLGKAQVVKQ